MPVYHVRLSAAKMPPLDPDSKSRRDRRREASARVAKALPAARQAWHDGDYGAIKVVLAQVEPDFDFLDTGEAVDVGVLLGVAHAAYDDSDLAVAAFRRVLERQPHKVLRRYEYSPKIIALWQKASGSVE